MDKHMKLNVGRMVQHIKNINVKLTCFLNSLLIRQFLSTGHLVI